MKKFNLISLALLTLMFLGACEQEVLELSDRDTTIPPDPCSGSSGSANFTKFVAIGNSFVAGVQGGALFTDGQNNSLASIVAKQLACAGGSSTFNQPNINATLGWNLFVTQPILTDDTKPVLGRMLLQGNPPRPTPQAYAVGNIEALPNPSLNTNFMYSGDKSALNNFSVPAVYLGQSLITQTGNWALVGLDPRFNHFYGRFASTPGTSTMIGDAATAAGSFFLFWLGFDDFLLHAANGGDPTIAPLTPATGGLPNGFDGQYAAAVGTLLASNPNLKGIVGNFPNIFTMPHFTSVAYNAIPLDAATAAQLNAGFAGYNAALDGLKNPAFAGAFGTAAQLDARKITFAAGNNRPVLIDETLLNLSAGFDALPISTEDRAKLEPYVQVRQTTTTDILPLSTGSVLGTLVGGNPLLINGLTVPLADRYVLIPSEITAINNARNAYNSTVLAVVAANNSRLALANVENAMRTLTVGQAAVYNNVTITPNINPPTGIFSEDGLHLNSRGYAFLANVFIQGINNKFGATIPPANLSKYPATGLPIP